MPPGLGIDVGRVLIWPGSPSGQGDTSFFGKSMEAVVKTPPYPQMFEVLPKLVARFDAHVWIVSKAHPRTQERTLRWLEHHRFFERTGVTAGNVRFCLERREKAEHCRELKLTHFIDDRVDVLEHMSGIVPNRYLFGPQPETGRGRSLIAVRNWDDVLARVNP